jgi:hypothetical protein
VENFDELVEFRNELRAATLRHQEQIEWFRDSSEGSFSRIAPPQDQKRAERTESRKISGLTTTFTCLESLASVVNGQYVVLGGGQVKVLAVGYFWWVGLSSFGLRFGV